MTFRISFFCSSSLLCWASSRRTAKRAIRSASEWMLIDGKTVLAWEDGEAQKAGTIPLIKGKKYPIEIVYAHDHGENTYLNLLWSWAGQPTAAIPREAPRTISRAGSTREDFGRSPVLAPAGGNFKDTSHATCPPYFRRSAEPQ
ncbi:MAG: hypothetical protein EHM61_06425 [Acidobacteria bacterium]|nr:MAG: hypothetical protein EHM61_06425 [Acidobacteriota bacterium]